MNHLGVESWLGACSNENMQREAVEHVASASILITKVKGVRQETCSVHKRATLDA